MALYAASGMSTSGSSCASSSFSSSSSSLRVCCCCCCCSERNLWLSLVGLLPIVRYTMVPEWRDSGVPVRRRPLEKDWEKDPCCGRGTAGFSAGLLVLSVGAVFIFLTHWLLLLLLLLLLLFLLLLLLSVVVATTKTVADRDFCFSWCGTFFKQRGRITPQPPSAYSLLFLLLLFPSSI